MINFVRGITFASKKVFQPYTFARTSGLINSKPLLKNDYSTLAKPVVHASDTSGGDGEDKFKKLLLTLLGLVFTPRVKKSK